jgi:CRP-like cAMP-binding protein
MHLPNLANKNHASFVKVLQKFQEVKFKNGQTVIKTGQPSEFVYLICTGSIRLEVTQNPYSKLQYE